MRKYWELFKLGLWLGSTVFGGVNQAYPLIRQKAQQLGWMEAEEVDGTYALAVFLPGPSFLNLWGAVSMRTGGFFGAVIGQVGLLLPAFCLVYMIPLLGRIEWFAGRADGAMLAAVYATAGLLIASGIEGIRKVKQGWHKLMAGIMLALLFLGVHPLVLLLGAVTVGALHTLRTFRKETA